MSKKVAHTGVLVALAFVFGYIEVMLPYNFAVPGIKLGIANIVVVVALYYYGMVVGATVSFIRVFLAAITFSNAYTFMYSFMGAVGSFIIMSLLKKSKAFSIKGVSMLGAVTHNVCQVLTAAFMMENSKILWGYIPWLLPAGVIMGYITGTLCCMILKRIKGFGMESKDVCDNVGS